MFRTSHITTWTLCCSVLASGCAIRPSTDYSDLGLLNIGGQITLDDKPLAHATVRFESSDATYSYGLTDANGNYRLMLNSEQSGVTPGTKVVRITTLPTPESNQGEIEELEQTDAPPAASGPDQVPVCFNEASKLRVKITESDSNRDFHLKSDQ